MEKKKYMTPSKHKLYKRDKSIINEWEKADSSKEAFSLCVHQKYHCSMATVKRVILAFEKELKNKKP
jgi:hypothetical protein